MPNEPHKFALDVINSAKRNADARRRTDLMSAQEARDISETFSAAMKELDEAEIEVELRGLRIGKDLPENILPNDFANCFWLIADFDEDTEPEKEKKVIVNP